jgi:histone deacetylase complex regulatory component SIN3
MNIHRSTEEQKKQEIKEFLERVQRRFENKPGIYEYFFKIIREHTHKYSSLSPPLLLFSF